MQRKPLNLLNAMATFFAKVRGVALSPTELLDSVKMRKLRRAATRYHRHSGYSHCGKRQQQRYARNRMDEQQRNSHKPGTVQPFHIFGAKQ